MSEQVVIAIDAMGGDSAPDSVIHGVRLAWEKNRDVFFLIFGDEKKVKPLLDMYRLPETAYKIHHTDQVIKGNEKPSVALRSGRESSLFRAIKSVRNGYAGAVVSAGNTGALMAISKICLGMIPGVDRPAIVAVMPTSANKDFVMLDLGANTEANAQNLVEFAMMGVVYANLVLGVEKPRVGLLNIGSEDIKGREEIREAAHLLKEMDDKTMIYEGFIEGTDIGTGRCDVIVSDGFTGNVALKTIEGTARMCKNLFKQMLSKSILAKLGFIFMIPAMLRLKAKIDVNRYNGAMLIGLNGISIKSHGSSGAKAHASAICRAIRLVRKNLCAQIKEKMAEVSMMSDLDEEL